jgi:predicted phosphodiesterase
MRIYFFGDVHGNALALDECLKQADVVSADKACCLGDIAGWLPFGDRTVMRMRSLGIPSVAGNHDLLVTGSIVDHPRQVDRMQATAYNAGLLSMVPGALEYLRSLPLILEEDDYAAVHHSPFHLPSPGEPPDIGNFGYLDDAALAGCIDAWRAHPKRLILSGHDHIPVVYELPDAVPSPQFQDVIVHRPPSHDTLTISLDPASRYWVKAGSVGGPYRDGIPMANSVLYNSDSRELTLFRRPFPRSELSRELAEHRFCRNIPTIQRYIQLLESTAPGFDAV